MTMHPKLEIAALEAEIERLTPYVEAFRREEARADKYGGELDEKDAEIERLTKINVDHCRAVTTLILENSRQADEIERLRACRTELDYVFEYYTHGLRPLDLRDWYNRACTALKDTKP